MRLSLIDSSVEKHDRSTHMQMAVGGRLTGYTISTIFDRNTRALIDEQRLGCVERRCLDAESIDTRGKALSKEGNLQAIVSAKATAVHSELTHGTQHRKRTSLVFRL